MKEDLHYGLIKKFYGNKKSKRSNIPLINHIDEGLIILDRLVAPLICKQAYCIHPLLQLDEVFFYNLVSSRSGIKNADVQAVMLAMEYRHQLNRYHSKKVFKDETRKKELLTSLKEVMADTPYLRYIALADKVQNRKDFIKYHLDTHERSKELNSYFSNWLFIILGVPEHINTELVNAINCNGTM